MRPSLPILRALLLAAAVLAGLQACGRRGPPDRPDIAAARAEAEVKGGQAATPAPPPGSRESRDGHLMPNRPFILDPLL
jgi:predicted small lipoprotein YifL